MEPDNRDFLELVRDTEAAVTALLTALGAALVRIILSTSRRGRTSQKKLIDAAIKHYVDSYRVIVTDAVAAAGGLQAEKKRRQAPAIARACRRAQREAAHG